MPIVDIEFVRTPAAAPLPSAAVDGEIDMQTLTTARLVLEPLAVAHAPQMFPVLSDAAIYRHLDYGPPPSLEHVQNVYAKLARRRSPEGDEIWLNWIVCPQDGQPVGFVQATVFAPASAWIAYILGSAQWGRGYATEATAAMVSHLESVWGVTSFLATVEVANAPSIRLLERLGFVEATTETAAAHELTPSERLFVCGHAPR